MVSTLKLFQNNSLGSPFHMVIPSQQAATPATSCPFLAMDPLKLSEFRAFVKMCRHDPSILHIEGMHFLREWMENVEGKIPPTTRKNKSEENKEEKTNSKNIEENIKHQVRKVI